MARDLDEVRRIVRRAARELSGADGATFVLREGEWCHYVDEDAIGPLWKGQRFPMSACISGWTMANRQPAYVPDIYADSRIPIDAYRPTFVRSLVVVPIREIDPVGAIGAYWAEPREIAVGTVALIQALANSTAVAIENITIQAQLEERVAQRTAQLQSANEELDAFSYSVSHDLRAPLRHVSGFARLLQQRSRARPGSEEYHYIERIIGSADHMSHLIDDLLGFARLGRAPLQTRPVPLHTLVEGARHHVSGEAAQRTIEWRIEGEGVVVDGDPGLLQQAMVNLLSNAVKYTRGREVARIDIGIGARTATEVSVFIRDNGAGFDPEYAHRLFTPFQRLHSSEQFEGTGIGLANVRRIVQRHGGRTWAEGSPDRGATFWFTLPLSTAA